MELRPVLCQPPLLVKVKRASVAERRGAVAQRVMTTARKPVMWTARAAPSVERG
jgi:hypothetical protein